MDLVVYYDKDYPTWWISRSISQQIVNFLVQKNFNVKNANDLAVWMEKAVDTKTAYDSLVVFSQDVFPDTIYHSPSPSCLARLFLDSGGTIVWVGDNPFYYQGLSSAKVQGMKQEELKQAILSGVMAQNSAGEVAFHFNIGGPYGALGIIPVFMHSPSDQVKVTKKGISFGLKTAWYGNRPIIKQGETLHRKLSVLGSSKPIFPISVKKILLQSEVEKGISVPKVLSSFSDLLGLAPAVVTIIAIAVSFVKGWLAANYVYFVIAAIISALVYGGYWYLRRRETFASAWFKNYNDSFPDSGFLRIWDFQPFRITNEMLEDLYKVCINRSKK